MILLEQLKQALADYELAYSEKQRLEILTLKTMNKGLCHYADCNDMFALYFFARDNGTPKNDLYMSAVPDHLLKDHYKALLPRIDWLKKHIQKFENEKDAIGRVNADYGNRGLLDHFV